MTVCTHGGLTANDTYNLPYQFIVRTPSSHANIKCVFLCEYHTTMNWCTSEILYSYGCITKFIFYFQILLFFSPIRVSSSISRYIFRVFLVAWLLLQLRQQQVTKYYNVDAISQPCQSPSLTVNGYVNRPPLPPLLWPRLHHLTITAYLSMLFTKLINYQ